MSEAGLLIESLARVYPFLHLEDVKVLEHLQDYRLLAGSPEPLVGLRV